eukprot:Sspe_Gene.61217::Locus_33914_Transcript_1_1_Confidence_1.000_Length_1154::g.61217::m.61217
MLHRRLLRLLPNISYHPTSLHRCTVRAASTALRPGPKSTKSRLQHTTANQASDEGDRVVRHPSSGDLLRFDSERHSYLLLSNGRALTSVTSLLHRPLVYKKEDKGSVVPHFDVEMVAASVAAAQNRTVEDVKEEWRELAVFGSKFHSFVYKEITGKVLPGSEQFTAEEASQTREQKFMAAFREYHKQLQQHGYQAANGGAEMIVFSPKLGVAGTIDCVMECKKGNEFDPKPHIMILDWKTNRAHIRKGRVYGEPTTFGWPFENLQNLKLSEYALQLNVYRHLLVNEGYVKRGNVKMALVHFQQGENGDVVPDGISIPEIPADRIELLLSAKAKRRERVNVES